MVRKDIFVDDSHSLYNEVVIFNDHMLRTEQRLNKSTGKEVSESELCTENNDKGQRVHCI